MTKKCTIKSNHNNQCNNRECFECITVITTPSLLCLLLLLLYVRLCICCYMRQSTFLLQFNGATMNQQIYSLFSTYIYTNYRKTCSSYHHDDDNDDDDDQHCTGGANEVFSCVDSVKDRYNKEKRKKRERNEFLLVFCFSFWFVCQEIG